MRILIIAMGRSGGYSLLHWIGSEKKYQTIHEPTMDNGDILKITGNHKVKLINGSWKKVEDLDEKDEILYIKEKMKSHEFDNNGEGQNI